MSTQAFLTQLAYTHFALHRNLGGLSHDDSLRSPEPGGNCLNWVVGHVVATRSHWLRELGRPGLLPMAVEERYRRGSAPIDGAEGAEPLEALVAAFDRGQEELTAALPAMTGEQLAGPAPFSPGNDPAETWHSLTAGLLFHEAYHVGQTGVLRRLLGRPGAIR